MKEKIQQQLNDLSKSVDTFLGLLSGMNDEQAQFKTLPDKWCGLEILEHLILTDQSILMFVTRHEPRPRAAKNIDSRQFEAIKQYLNSRKSVKVPLDFLVPKGNKGRDELVKKWQAIHEQLKDFTNAFPADKYGYTIIKHPLGGPINLFQTLEFLSLHNKRHTRQLQDILIDEKYLQVV